MVSNFDRIYGEIRKEAHQIARDYGLEPEAVVTLRRLIEIKFPISPRAKFIVPVTVELISM